MIKVIPFFVFIFLFALTGCGSGGSASHKADRFSASYGMAKTRPDSIAARRIVMVETHSGERLDTVYYHDGAYDKKELRKINLLFRDRHANQIGEIDPELIDYLVDIRTRFNLPPTVTFQILNGYRTRETNAMMSRSNKNVAIESLHIHGWAVDFRVPNVDGRAICEIAKTMQRGGVAFYPKSNHVHVDLGNIRTWKEK